MASVLEKLESLRTPENIVLEEEEDNYPNPVVDLPKRQRFKLPFEVKAELRSMPVEFGFGLLGAVTYYRTYSRQKADGSQEQWADTVIRVIEGVFTIRKWWYLRNNIEWDDEKWTKLAVEMAYAVHRMEMLPPGRGLWAMGSDWMYQRGSAALYNCGYVEVRTLSEDAAWTMDMLMCGVGTGHNTQFFGNPTYYKPDESQRTTCVIADSREGWVESLRELIVSYEQPNKNYLEFDYSKIRPAGAPIKGFGGTASGHEPLKKLHDRVREYLDLYVDGTRTAERVVVDVMNAIGACVVAGNVRRSAEISLGDPTNEEFLNLKNYGHEETFYHCEEHGEFQVKIPSWYTEDPEQWKCPVCDKNKPVVKEPLTSFYVDLTQGVPVWGVVYECPEHGKRIVGKYTKDDAPLELPCPECQYLRPYILTKKKVYIEGPSYDRREIGWMSNNSVVIDSFSDLKELPKLAERVIDNGEPGIFNLLNIQKYGRYGEKSPDKATGANPCAEIPLEDGEVCNLVEVFPTRCVDSEGNFDQDTFFHALELATLYASTVSLLPTHSERTNKVVERNRRIGVSLSGIADWMEAHPMTDVITWLDRGYSVVKNQNVRLAWEAKVNPSIRVTTVKPSGTISLLAGTSSGMHLPPFSRYIRRVRIGVQSPLVPILQEAGVPNESDAVSDNTLVFEFPVDRGTVKGQKDVSVWSKAMTVVMLQKFWADNMVSNTLHFDPMTERDQLEDLLAFVVPFIKTISFMPIKDYGKTYKQLPEEETTLADIRARQKAIKPIDWSSFGGSDGQDSKFCSNDSCEV